MKEISCIYICKKVRALARRAFWRKAGKGVIYTSKFNLSYHYKMFFLSWREKKKIPAFAELRQRALNLIHRALPAICTLMNAHISKMTKIFRKINYLSFAIQSQEDAPWEEVKQNSNRELPGLWESTGRFLVLWKIKLLSRATSHAFSATVYDN